MKFRGHETFPIRKGWLNKGIRNVKTKPDVFISKTENPMDSLGIGANMVKGLRYWLQATKLTEERKSGQHVQALTEFGKIIYENDPYFEELGTLWLIHYALASNTDDATAWYIFFNAFDLIEFSEEDFEKCVKKYISMNVPDADIPSSRAITDDASNYVQEQMKKIKGDCLFLVDEAHNFGATNLSELLNERFQYRLALSATLERHHDEEGTQKLKDYFGEKCIEYTLERAIAEEKLTRYKYYPIMVELTDEEQKQYFELTKEIGKCLKVDKKGKTALTEKGKKLCLKRARLVAAASAKIEALRQQIAAYRKDTHILVYCGAASLKDYGSDTYPVDEEEIRQIDLVTDLLGNQMDRLYHKKRLSAIASQAKMMYNRYRTGGMTYGSKSG